jgi:preprotein translocase subunit YajC
VILPYDNYGGKYSGKCGFIRKIKPSYERVGVEFDDVKNPNSQYGLFWFERKYLNPLKSINLENESEEIKLLNGYKSVGIKFLEGSNTEREYIYACYDEVQEGDYVVVKSGHHGWGLAIISQVFENEVPVECNREVICKFDPSAHFARIEKVKRLAEIKRDMDAKVKELQHLAIYEALAKDSPEMKELLDEFKSLI